MMSRTMEIETAAVISFRRRARQPEPSYAISAVSGFLPSKKRFAGPFEGPTATASGGDQGTFFYLDLFWRAFLTARMPLED